MAKETTIIFLYDTELLKHEEDDPNSAILYFYPTWVSDQQKTVLCGQLMGSAMCLQSILAMPKIISVQTGKFFLIENGRYILVVGTDRDIPDWVLEHRASLIYSLLNFFHKDFVTLALIYQKENLTAKLYHIFDTYLKLLYLGGDVFNHMPLLMLSEDENANILKKSKGFLDSCKTIQKTLGGVLLYHNKVVHTQLSTQTTKKIVFSDPYRIKNPADITDSTSKLPPGVKLLQVYICSEEFKSLVAESTTGLSEECNKLESEKLETPQKDTSLLFTSVPENDSVLLRKQGSSNNSKKKKVRPNSLNISSYSLDYTEHTSNSYSSTVCTPMSETKSFVDPPKSKLQAEKMIRDFGKISFDAKDVFREKNSLELHRQRWEKSKAFMRSIRSIMQNSLAARTLSLPNLASSGMPNQYCITEKQIIWHSTNDPLFPWAKENGQNMSQCYIQDITPSFQDEMKKEQINERKKFLSLPIKPHNASEPQKSELKSASGYCTPLMSKLSMTKVFAEQQQIPTPTFSKKDNNDIRQFEKCFLFIYGERDLVFTSILMEKNLTVINELYHQCTEQLPKLEKQVRACIALPKQDNWPGITPYSILTLDANWDTTKRSGPWDSTDLNDLTQFHEDFCGNKDLCSIYLRKPDSVLFAQKEDQTQVFYHEVASSSHGLLSRNDPLGTVHQTAKKRFENNHNVFIK